MSLAIAWLKENESSYCSAQTWIRTLEEQVLCSDSVKSANRRVGFVLLLGQSLCAGRVGFVHFLGHRVHAPKNEICAVTLPGLFSSFPGLELLFSDTAFMIWSSKTILLIKHV
ncbi:hypothetical protein TorRG33x02_287720 [Trema orientale]|uniref:Uncharacterized protein n=1 Tax=Trema orientale TaxID=63057 RepID=A0A2P5CEV2_TREOI|nr:hypothetical protein TorRG33x02_287720 [Trema orientale]